MEYRKAKQIKEDLQNYTKEDWIEFAIELLDNIERLEERVEELEDGQIPSLISFKPPREC